MGSREPLPGMAATTERVRITAKNLSLFITMAVFEQGMIRRTGTSMQWF
jgi:hypothetical protein